MRVPLGLIVNIGDLVSYQGVKAIVVDMIENEIGTDDMLTLADERLCLASELDETTCVGDDCATG